MRGLLALALAVCAFVWPEKALGIFVKLLGAYFLIDGIIAVVNAYRSGDKASPRMQAIISLTLGLVLLFLPDVSGKLFLILVGIWLVLQGIAPTAGGLSHGLGRRRAALGHGNWRLHGRDRPGFHPSGQKPVSSPSHGSSALRPRLSACFLFTWPHALSRLEPESTASATTPDARVANASRDVQSTLRMGVRPCRQVVRAPLPPQYFAARSRGAKREVQPFGVRFGGDRDRAHVCRRAGQSRPEPLSVPAGLGPALHLAVDALGAEGCVPILPVIGTRRHGAPEQVCKIRTTDARLPASPQSTTCGIRVPINGSALTVV